MTLDSKTQPSRSSSAVIVAEKHPIARAALAALLSYDGYRAFQAEDLSSALGHILSVDNLAAVLVDLDLPGWRTIIHHALNGNPTLIIAMRGHHLVTQDELKKRGVHACFDKPITYSDVALRLKAHAAENKVETTSSQSSAQIVNSTWSLAKS